MSGFASMNKPSSRLTPRALRSLASLRQPGSACRRRMQARTAVKGDLVSRTLTTDFSASNDAAPGYPKTRYPEDQSWPWQRPSPKESLDWNSLQQGQNARPFMLNLIELVHWVSFPIGFGVFYIVFTNAQAISATLDISMTQVFCLLMGLITQAYGAGISGNIMHEYEGWQIAPSRNPLRGKPIEDIQSYNNSWLRSITYQFLFSFQTMGLLLFNLGIWGFSPATVLMAVVTMTLAFVGPRQPIFALYIDKAKTKSVLPLPWALLIISTVTGIFSFSNYWSRFGSHMTTALPDMITRIAGSSSPLMPAVAHIPGHVSGGILACIPLFLVVVGGVMEGVLAEATFDQRWHLGAFIAVDIGMCLHGLLYLRILGLV